MAMNIKVALLVTALVVAGGAGYAILTVQPASNNSVPVADVADTSAPESSPLVLQGTVTGVDASKMQILLQASTTNPLKVVNVTPSTKIEKVISQKDAKGIVEKQSLIEVNIEDVRNGNPVTVVYQSEKDGVLSGVSRITFVVDGNIEAYFKSQSASQTPYLKGQVVAIDIAGKTLQYKPIFFDTVGTTTTSVDIPDGISVYRVADPLRISIIHARTAVTLADIQPGRTVFIMANDKSIKAGKVAPQAFIISGK